MEQPRTRRERREMERARAEAEQARQATQPASGGTSGAEAGGVGGPAPESDQPTQQFSPVTFPQTAYQAPAASRPFIRPAEPNATSAAANNSYNAQPGAQHNSQPGAQPGIQGDIDQTQPFQAVQARPQDQAGQRPQDEPLPTRAQKRAQDQAAHAQHRRNQKPERQPLGVVRGTIRTFGELCITAGLIMILFVVWQLWWTDIEANRDNENLASNLVTQWKDNPRDKTPDDPDTPVIAKTPEENQAFGIMYVPRFGDDYYRTIAEGVQLEPVLNRMGMGHYPSSARPGEVGNFAMAGHRVTYGKPLNLIAEMRPGDPVVIQTQEGFYTYTMRNFDIILPDQTEVLAPVPGFPEYKGKERLMTLTACNPMFSARERYVIYAELTEWRPASEGPPDAIKDSAAFKKAGGQ
ncbi:class E sortase [Brevibacterium sp. UMB1308A]|uniref:class E sortase n=1 Tax=Brevibacterium sp. UMB1308A TaxID=3050608 RepID=UPI00254AF966|nr:class E sortase [Brevibacterium sp. UMB1308A]MDK8346733.1 class E sortase [Brevibacterium sp. UMB1308B]MDK8714073.1 class E sortase [Brevibacterium sp. UMB1308A]